MWLMIRILFSTTKYILAVSLAIALLIGAGIDPDKGGDRAALVTMNAFFLIIFTNSFFFIVAKFALDSSERLWSQLPLTRYQIANAKLIFLLLWMLIFYLAACISIFANVGNTNIGYFIDLFGIYLLVTSCMVLLGLASNLSNIRNRYWLIAYLVVGIPILLVFIGETSIYSNDSGRLTMTTLDISINFPIFTLLLAVVTLTVMQITYLNRNYYLK